MRRNISPSAQLTSERLKDIIEDEKNTDKGGREVEEQVEDGEGVLNPENTSSELNAVLNTINNEFEHMCLGEAVTLQNAHPIGQSTDDPVPGLKYSISGLAGTKFLAHQVWAIWFIVRRWVWDSDMPGALVADEMGLGKTFTLVAAAIICKLLTVKAVMELPLLSLWGNTHKEWVNLIPTTVPGLSVKNGRGIPSRRKIKCRAASWRSRKSTSVSPSAYISLVNNPGGDNAWSCRDIQECR